MGCGAGQLRADLKQKDEHVEHLQAQLRSEAVAESAAASSQLLVEDLQGRWTQSNQDWEQRHTELQSALEERDSLLREALASNALRTESKAQLEQTAQSLGQSEVEWQSQHGKVLGQPGAVLSRVLGESSDMDEEGMLGQPASVLSQALGDLEEQESELQTPARRFAPLQPDTDRRMRHSLDECESLQEELVSLRHELAEAAEELSDVRHHYEQEVSNVWHHYEQEEQCALAEAREGQARCAELEDSQAHCAELEDSMEALRSERNKFCSERMEAIAGEADCAFAYKRVLCSRNESLASASREYELALLECGKALLDRDEALQDRSWECLAAENKVNSLHGLLENAAEQIDVDRAQILKLQDLISLCARSGAARAAAAFWECWWGDSPPLPLPQIF